MLSNELLSELHGQVSLNAVHRFMSHNPEWVGQTIGAGLGPESEEGWTNVSVESESELESSDEEDEDARFSGGS